MAVNQCLGAIGRDHSDIRAMLNVLAAAVERSARGLRLDDGMIAGLARFFDEFVAAHDERDRDVLLPELEESSPASDRRAVERLVWSASRGRRMRRRLVDLLRSELHNPKETARLTQIAAEYTTHQRSQLQEEDRLMGRVLSRFTPAEEQALADVLARLERTQIGATGREWYAQLVEDYRDITASWTARPLRTGR